MQSIQNASSNNRSDLATQFVVRNNRSSHSEILVLTIDLISLLNL